MSLVSYPHPYAVSFLLQLLQDLGQEILKAEGDVPVPVIVVLFEHIRHALEGDTSLDEQIKAHDALAALIVGAEDELHETGGETVAEGDEGVAELVEGDVSGAIGVEAVEEGAPGGEEGPEAAELGEADCAGAVRVEHADHHADGLGVEGGPVAVDEGGGEFALGELAGAVLVDGAEEGEEGRVGAVGGEVGVGGGRGTVVGGGAVVVLGAGVAGGRWGGGAEVVLGGVLLLEGGRGRLLMLMPPLVGARGLRLGVVAGGVVVGGGVVAGGGRGLGLRRPGGGGALLGGELVGGYREGWGKCRRR
jgi:hypothetical protein